MRFALIFPSVINKGEDIYCILSHAVIQFSLFIVRCDQKWIYRDSNYFELHINWILFRQARNQTMWQKSLTLYLTGAKVQQLFQSEKSIGFIGVLILYLETGVCCMFPSYISAWSSIAYLLFNVLSRIYFSSTLLSWLYFCSNYF